MVLAPFPKTSIFNWARWLTPLIPALWSQRQAISTSPRRVRATQKPCLKIHHDGDGDGDVDLHEKT